MKDPKKLFHYSSYLQYPLMLVGLYFVYKPFVYGYDSIWVDYNKALIFLGLGISFSTLQDTQKTQNKLSKRVWENPKRATVFLLYIVLLILSTVLFGMYCLLNELSFGVIALGIGLIGVLKSAIEMADHQQRK
jgi:hypothetical protein